MDNRIPTGTEADNHPEALLRKNQMLAIDMLVRNCHEAQHQIGWWHDATTGLPLIPHDCGRYKDGTPYDWDLISEDDQNWIMGNFPFVLATKIALLHSETSEALEALRRNIPDDKLPQHSGIATEFADVLVRTFDIAGAISRAEGLDFKVAPAQCAEFDLAKAFCDKMIYNASRVDHSVSARRKVGGKRF